MKVLEKSAGSAETVQRGTRRLNSSKPRYLFEVRTHNHHESDSTHVRRHSVCAECGSA